MQYGDGIDINALSAKKCSDFVEFLCTVCNKVGAKRKANIKDILKKHSAVYCSYTCSRVAHSRNSELITVPCSFCETPIKHKEFIVKRKMHANHGNIFCSITCSNKFRGLKAPWISKFKQGVYHTWYCKECNKEMRTVQSKKGVYCSLQCSNKNKYHVNSNKNKRCVYNGVKLDSGAEMFFVKLLDDNKIQWFKNTQQFFVFVDRNGVQRKYYPDFFLPDYNWWVEIKGKRYVRVDDDLRLQSVGNITNIDSQNINLDFLSKMAPIRGI